MQAKSEDVSTHFLTDGVLAHALITASLAFTSISAMDFYIPEEGLFERVLKELNRC
jgi:hypothetical protein